MHFLTKSLYFDNSLLNLKVLQIEATGIAVSGRATNLLSAVGCAAMQNDSVCVPFLQKVIDVDLLKKQEVCLKRRLNLLDAEMLSLKVEDVLLR